MLDVKVAGFPQRGLSPAMRWIATSVLVVAAVAAMGSAHAQGHGGAGPGSGGMMMFGGPPEHIGRAVDHMLDGLNATDAQRSQIKAIAMAASADLRAQRDAGRALRDKGMQIFTAPTVDAGAAEALRQQMSAQHDQASRRMLQAMLDVAKVLTPEQRAKIGERIKERQAVMKDRMERMQQERAQRGQHPVPQK